MFVALCVQENVLLDSEGHIKVTDFGLAKRMSDDMRANSFIGTMEVSPAAAFRRYDWCCMLQPLAQYDTPGSDNTLCPVMKQMMLWLCGGAVHGARGGGRQGTLQGGGLVERGHPALRDALRRAALPRARPREAAEADRGRQAEAATCVHPPALDLLLTYLSAVCLP